MLVDKQETMLELRTTKVTIAELTVITEERQTVVINTTMMEEAEVLPLKSIEDLLLKMAMKRREETERNIKMKDMIRNHRPQNGHTTVTILSIKTKEHQTNTQRESQFMEAQNMDNRN